jgi:small conductance mechanosensitive channel
MTDMKVTFADFFSGDWQSVVVTCARMVLILLVAFILSRVVRRAVRRLAARTARRHEKRMNREDQEADQRVYALRDKLSDILPSGERNARAAQRAKTLGTTAASIFNFVIWFIALLLCLAELNINLGPILAGAGIVGVALGFGAQSLVRDFLSGIFIIVEDQYGVGDTVNVGEAQGVVEEVTLRATRIRGLDGTMWHVPNGEIRRAGNMSQYWARVILDVPVAYDADVTAASALIKRVADETWHDHENTDILEEPELWGVEEFGNDAIAVRLVVKTLPATQWTVARELRARIKEAFDREGFAIPFQQRTVWLRQQPEESTDPKRRSTKKS